jgi:hypothetical protein
VGVLREGCLLNRGPGGRAQHWRPKFQFRRPQELDPYLNRAMEVDNFQCPTPQKPTDSECQGEGGGEFRVCGVHLFYL